MNTSNTENRIVSFFARVTETLEAIDRAALTTLYEQLLTVYDRGGTVFLFGNGGSASTASHFCGDLVQGVSTGRTKRFRAVCLNDNIPALMAAANDLSYDEVFTEQLKSFLSPGDLVIGISCSGNSPNVIKALQYANERGVFTAGLCGFEGGVLKNTAQLVVHAPINDMEVSEDIHLILVHCLKQMLMEALDG